MSGEEIVAKLWEEGVVVSADILQKVRNGMSYQDIIAQHQENITPRVTVVKSYKDNHHDITVSDFTKHYQIRLDYMSAMLKNRTELENLSSIHRILQKSENEKISLIGFIYDIRETKNGHLMLTIEDKTEKIRVCVVNSEQKKELFDFAKDLVLDDIVGITGTVMAGKDPIIFADEIILPDIPNTNPLKKCPDDVNAVFIGDLHIGAKVFLQKDWDRFITWINQKTGDKKLDEKAAKVKYIIIVGDIIEGVGWYPNQEHDLSIIPFRDQYAEAARLIAQIPSHISIIICPGNHDIMRLSEPQPPIYGDIAKDLLSLPNIVNVSSPSVVNIHKTEDFPGFSLLLYHGYSFFYYLNNVPSIRQGGGIERIDLVMEFLLKRRHLAPAHTSTLFLPDNDRDELIIDEVPDFFISGHVHKSVVSSYKNVQIINCSCFVDVTDYQKKQGMMPDLAKVACVNLQTRAIEILDFHKND
ncbi:MAG: metallophosphoesterase [Candidatus Woesearchaeota archaeon]